ncbi:MAG: PEP-CTERM sorting domain-containing protein [Symploca sp. SIO2C1]|nr:PEP-CTERM sorting domain-containing protein [Symploca sp. SIO2C1]
MHVSLPKSLLVCSTILGMLGTTTSAANAASFVFDFESGLPAEALFLKTTQQGTLPFTPSIETIDGNSVLRFSDDLPSSEGGAITSSLVNPAATFENVKVSALLNPAGDTNDQLLLFARLDLETSNTYLAGIDFATNRLFLNKVIEGVVPATPIVEAFDVLPDLNQPYFAEFTVIDNQLTGRLFDETGTNELAELSAFDTDQPLSAGVTGISVDISDIGFPKFDDPNNATIDNFAATSVPEPSSILGLLAVGAFVTKISQRRSVSAKFR